MGYAGVQLGPASTGFVAQHGSLPGAFILVTAALACATFIGSTLRVR